MRILKPILTCQVFILTPFVVFESIALFTFTSETKSVELPAPKLPMLQKKKFIQNLLIIKLQNKNQQHNIHASCW
jgi:hypothetical protein